MSCFASSLTMMNFETPHDHHLPSTDLTRHTTTILSSSLLRDVSALPCRDTWAASAAQSIPI